MRVKLILRLIKGLRSSDTRRMLLDNLAARLATHSAEYVTGELLATQTSPRSFARWCRWGGGDNAEPGEDLQRWAQVDGNREQLADAFEYQAAQTRKKLAQRIKAIYCRST